MQEKESTKNIINCCNYCGWKFPIGFLQSASESDDSLFCENCGTEIIKIDRIEENDEEAEKDNKTDDNNEKKGFFSRIYETVRNEKNPIERVLRDSDFPEKFKDNLKIVVSRLIFPHIRALKSESAQDIENMELTEEILDDLYEKISPIMNQRIKDILLINLNNISVKEFNKWLKFLQEKIELNKSFHKDFIIYLRWMIKEVFIIISELWDATDIPKFERIIRDDLKSFELNLYNLTNSREYSTINDLNNKGLIDNSTDLENKTLDLIPKKASLTNSFRGSLLNKVKDAVCNLIKTDNLKYRDFNSEDIIINILNQIEIPSTFEEIDNSSIIDKKTVKRRLKNKKLYISVLGKIMIDILNFSNNDTITDISERYNVSRDFTTKTAKFLANKHKFELKDRFPTTSARGSGSHPSKKTLEEIKIFSLNFKDSDLLIKKATEIFNDLISGSDKLTVDDLPLGYKTDPKYLAISIVYYALRHKSYSKNHKKFESLGVMEFINQNFPNDTTMKLAMTNTIPTLYNYISEELKNEIFYHPLVKIPRENYNRVGFINRLKNLKQEYREINRPDNVILINLIKTSLSYYKKGQFNHFIKDLLFWIKINKAWVLLEKLSIPDTLRRKSDLEDFVKNYFNLIKKLNIKKIEKDKLAMLLNSFEEERFIFYNYEDLYKEKKRREYKRYLTYGDNFFNPSSRIKRFLLMLGFSPYDGFDIWKNKIMVNGTHKIFANFHHYHYDPIDQSEDDLVFIPIKPPKNIRIKVYQEKKFLTHNMISGREGHLKKSITSLEKKRQIQEELRDIEERIEFNSKLIEDAVLSLDSNLLKRLKGWSNIDINKITVRLLNENFTWATRIENSIPLTKEHAQKKILPSEVRKIIQEILEERKSKYERLY